MYVGRVHDNKSICSKYKILGCHFCDEEFRSKKGLKEHFAKVHDKKKNQNQC